jgi:DMSO reductase anchor subunit
MKKRGAIYEQNSITYWPNYTTVTGSMYLFGLIGTGFALVAIIQIFLTDVDNTVLQVLALMFSIIFLYITIRIKGLKEKKVVIDTNGIAISQKQASETLHISWVEVNEIKHEHQLWYGLESLIITYKKPNEADPVRDSTLHYLRLPLRSIERDKIKQIVPPSIPFS